MWRYSYLLHPLSAASSLEDACSCFAPLTKWYDLRDGGAWTWLGLYPKPLKPAPVATGQDLVCLVSGASRTARGEVFSFVWNLLFKAPGVRQYTRGLTFSGKGSSYIAPKALDAVYIRLTWGIPLLPEHFDMTLNRLTEQKGLSSKGVQMKEAEHR